MSENIMKIWGERRRILLTNQTEIDLLYLKKDCFCSTHSHKYKSNKFIIVQGEVIIETEYGKTLLKKNESWEVYPPMVHRFRAITDATMIELAYVKEGNIDPNDINRISQGGKIFNGKEYTLIELKKNNMLNL